LKSQVRVHCFQPLATLKAAHFPETGTSHAVSAQQAPSVLAVDAVWNDLAISRSWLRGFVVLMPQIKWLLNGATATPSVRCRICNQIRALNADGSASNVESHLKHHDIDVKNVPEKERTLEHASTIVAKKLASVGTIAAAFSAPKVQHSNLRRTIEFELAIAQWAIAKGLPWNMFSGEEWHRLKAFFNVPHVVDGGQMRYRVFSNLKLLLEGEIKKMLTGLDAVALTADGWSDQTTGMTSVTVSWTDQSYNVHTIPIAACGHVRKATSQALKETWSTATYMDLMPEDTLLGIMTTDEEQITARPLFCL